MNQQARAPRELIPERVDGNVVLLRVYPRGKEPPVGHVPVPETTRLFAQPQS